MEKKWRDSAVVLAAVAATATTRSEERMTVHCVVLLLRVELLGFVIFSPLGSSSSPSFLHRLCLPACLSSVTPRTICTDDEDDDEHNKIQRGRETWEHRPPRKEQRFLEIPDSLNETGEGAGNNP